MIHVKDTIFIDENELIFDYIRSSGPGGQNVNKVATAVQLRFNAMNSTSLPDFLKKRLRQLAGSRMAGDGTIVIKAQRYRSQAQNRQDAIYRLIQLLWQAAQIPKPRKKRKPSLAAVQRRLESKRRRSWIKKSRRQRLFDEM
jgi:ribosome-associated protein